MMFLPNDLTASETELVASITRQVLESRSPSTSAEETAARQEATELAAEMIWEARRQSEQYEDEDQDLEQDLAQSPYHQRLAAARARNLEIQEAEDEEADRPL